MESDNDGHALQAFMAAFAKLTALDKAKARMAISSDVNSIPETTRTHIDATSGAANVHSCHICRKLVLSEHEDEQTPGDPVQDRDSSRFRTPAIRLKSDFLTQRRSRACIVVQWIFEFLSNSLFDFKKDFAEKGIYPTVRSSRDVMGDIVNNLAYIHPKGVHVQIYSSGKDGLGWIQFAYDADPYLLDRLWGAHDHRKYNNYDLFVKNHGACQNLRARIFTSPALSTISGIPTRSAEQIIAPDAGFEAAQTWLSKCQKTHEQCSCRTALFPTRVLDLGIRFPIRSVRLHWSEDGEEGQYVALSYCWGGQQPVVTIHHTAQDHTDGIVFSRLPQTIQDAAVAAVKLGIRYLWVDCLCIIQDDLEDVTREIALMAQTFENAFVTISAASAASVHEGFLYRRNRSQDTLLELPFETSEPTPARILVERIDQAQDPATDPINLRAWTLQEHILATRMLVYSTERLWWTCQESEASHAREQDDNKDIQFVPSQRKSDPERYTLRYWRSIVRDYSRRFLTYSNDKLPAIAGIAARYNQVFEGKYLAGLWESSLLSELMWCSDRSDITRPLVQRAPSWSWASVDGEVHHNWCPDNRVSYAPFVEHCYTTPVSLASPYGHVDTTRSVLRLRSEIARVAWCADKQYIHNTAPQAKTDHYRTRVGTVQPDAADELPVLDGKTIVWVLPIVTNPIRGLLLYQVDNSEFRRVGLVTRMLDEAFFAKTCEVRTINIR